MKIITNISYHGSGSGAIDDFLREFDNIPCGPSEYECRFLQDPDGISDLEYNLIENPNRLNSGFALKRYLVFCKKNKRMYKKIFGKKWLEYSKEYVDSLISLKYKGYWHRDIELLNPFQKVYYIIRKILFKLTPKKIRKYPYYNYFPKMDYYHSYISKDSFIKETQEYVDKLCSQLKRKDSDYVLLDQMVPPSNITRYLKYVKKMKVIIVDRDPRDVYINMIKLNSYVLPKTPKEFSKVYKDHRLMANIENNYDNVLRIQFEDLIYNYENTKEKIMNFYGLGEKNHIFPKKFFDPSISINNTQLWKKYPEFSEDIKVIENELKDYLYKF